MTMTYRINEIYGEAWLHAIVSVGEELGMRPSSWAKIMQLAERLNVRFDCNGNIVTEV